MAGTRATQPIAAAGGGDARGLHRVATHRPAAGEALPRGAGHRVHHRARQAVDAADPRRQAHRAGRGAHRGGPGEGEADHQGGGGAAGSRPSTSTSSSTRSSTPSRCAAARSERRLLASGLNVSPGAAVGQLAFDADTAERWAKQEKKNVIMVRPETKPDDVHGMLAARGILTSRGGRTSHAALVARQFGKPAVVGVMPLEVDADRKRGDDQAVLGGAPRGRLGLDRRHHWRGLSRPGRDDAAVARGSAPDRAARLGGRLPPPRASGPTPTTPAMPSVRAPWARRASGSAAPSTCSSRPIGCRWCRR